jgi:Cdc6-like AAA superfamily ATPase
MIEQMNFEKLSHREKHKITERIIVRYPFFNHIRSQLKHCHTFSKIAAEPECILITGVRGAGKTTLINSYAADFPRKITPEGTIVPVLKARVPAPASTKNLATELLKSLGDPNPANGSVHAQTLRLRSLLKDCEVELIMLDEFHQFIDRDSYSILYGTADWLKNLIDYTKIPVALWGLSYSSIILKANEQLLILEPQQ